MVDRMTSRNSFLQRRKGKNLSKFCELGVLCVPSTLLRTCFARVVSFPISPIRLRPQLLLKEHPDFFPTIHRLLLAVGRPVIVKETVTRAVVAVELIVFALLLQFRLMLIHLLR